MTMRNRRAGLTGAALTLILAGFWANSAMASTSVLFILDGSGSMWERVDGQPKIVTAKRVMSDVLRDLPPETAMGFMTYGTHRKGDCGDITLMTPIGTADASAISKQVSAITPKGDTPIAAALLKAGDALKSVPGNKMIVLVTDGAEECHGDPCASVKQLQANGLDVEINVVGFNLADKERQAVKCIAEEGHGQYFDARNTAGLTSAMKTVQTEVAQVAPPPPTPQPNLLAASQGGQVIVAPDNSWTTVINGVETGETSYTTVHTGNEAVFAFKDEMPATISKFGVLIAATRNENPKEIDVSVADNSPAGPFRSVGKLSILNARMMKGPYQELSFPQTTAKYLKIKLLSSYQADPGTGFYLSQIRVTGILQAAGAATQSSVDDTSVNLLSAAQGGMIVNVPTDEWRKVVNGLEDGSYASYATVHLGDEAVFSFKDQKPATFSKFAVLVAATANANTKQIELLAASASPKGPFRSLGKFTLANVRMMKSPYQEFSFAPVTAKFIKVKLLSSYQPDQSNGFYLSQIRVMGRPPH